ncbi:MAG TPA: biotin--[acetyl-CoA-carboxylase] ligase [Bryobacteraceae bacterium]|nr:biotin--[acetyl-CoA-carboxylase] ligase [Bryobacteraceae bacterium]
MILRLRSTSSTMKDAAALAAKGQPHGTAVVADIQTAGIGRHGHTWHSEDLGGLYLSIILRMPLASASMPILTMALGLAVQRAVNDFAQVSTDLRWPNDVMLSERKLAGILVQAAGDALIAGIGVNVNQETFPLDLAGIATSLKRETGRDHLKDDLAQRVIAESLRYTALLTEKGRREILRRFEESSTWPRGKAVEIDGRIRGVTAGLDDNGFLLVQTAEKLETIIAGGVRSL